MYITLKRDKKLLCDVDITSMKHEYAPNSESWSINISTYIDIQNFAETLLKIPEMFNMAQQEFIKDFKHIQEYRKDYNEEITKTFPTPKWYKLDDPQLKQDLYKVIAAIRKEMIDLADKWGLAYNED